MIRTNLVAIIGVAISLIVLLLGLADRYVDLMSRMTALEAEQHYLHGDVQVPHGK